MLLFQTIPALDEGNHAKVFSKNTNGEYTVKWYNQRGVHMDDSDYFTTDREDAMTTATLWLKLPGN